MHPSQNPPQILPLPEQLLERAIQQRRGINQLFNEGNHLDVFLHAMQATSEASMAAACSHNAKIPTSNLISGQSPNPTTHFQTGLQPFKDLAEKAAQQSAFGLDLNRIFTEAQAREIVSKTDQYLRQVIADHCPRLKTSFDAKVKPLSPAATLSPAAEISAPHLKPNWGQRR